MGVVTEFRFNTFPAPETLTYYVAALKWGTAERMMAGFKLVQEFAQDMPKELNMRLFMTPRFINLEGLYYGDKASFKAIFDPLVAKTNATVQLTQQGGWLDQIKHFGGGLNLDQGHPYDVVSFQNGASATIVHLADNLAARDIQLGQSLHQRPERYPNQPLCQLLVSIRQVQQEGLVCPHRCPRRKELGRVFESCRLDGLRPPRLPFHVSLLRPRRQGGLPRIRLFPRPKLRPKHYGWSVFQPVGTVPQLSRPELGPGNGARGLLWQQPRQAEEYQEGGRP